MAVAPLNKFLTIAVPVAPGEQTVYTTPTGTSAIVLYAQVSNVSPETYSGVEVPYPKVTFTHRRKSVATRTAGNTRNNRIVKEVEIPPNDSVILIDGRLVLERTALISDSIVIEGSQIGVIGIKSCEYDNITGLTTITTQNNHFFSEGDEITMSGLEFSCSSSVGITTTIYPTPQTSFVVSKIFPLEPDKFEIYSGVVAGIAHTYIGGGQVCPLQMEFICSILENSTV